MIEVSYERGTPVIQILNPSNRKLDEVEGQSGHSNPLNGIQGYLAHKKPHPPRTLQSAYISGPLVVLGGGLFLMSEVPLYPMTVPKRA